MVDNINSNQSQNQSFGGYFTPYQPQQVSYSDDEYASKTYAGITRDQWADYQKRYMPIHGELFDAAFSSKLVDEQIGRVNANVDMSFKNAEQGVNASRGRMGLDAIESNSGLDKVKAQGHAKNNIRSAGEQRRDTAFTGAANSVVPNRGE